MNKYGSFFCMLIVASAMGMPTFGQKENAAECGEEHSRVPVDTQLTLDAAPKMQRPAIRSVLLLQCKKTSKKGTAFVVSGDVVVTAAHVICGCEASDLEATTTLGRKIPFLKVVRDDGLDLAALKDLRAFATST